jgi:hypothetical protein
VVVIFFQENQWSVKMFQSENIAKAKGNVSWKEQRGL